MKPLSRTSLVAVIAFASAAVLVASPIPVAVPAFAQTGHPDGASHGGSVEGVDRDGDGGLPQVEVTALALHFTGKQALAS